MTARDWSEELASLLSLDHVRGAFVGFVRIHIAIDTVVFSATARALSGAWRMCRLSSGLFVWQVVCVTTWGWNSPHGDLARLLYCRCRWRVLMIAPSWSTGATRGDAKARTTPHGTPTMMAVLVGVCCSAALEFPWRSHDGRLGRYLLLRGDIRRGRRAAGDRGDPSSSCDPFFSWPVTMNVADHAALLTWRRRWSAASAGLARTVVTNMIMAECPALPSRTRRNGTS